MFEFFFSRNVLSEDSGRSGFFVILLIAGSFLAFSYGALRVLLPDIGQRAGTIMALLALIMIFFQSKVVRGSAPLWLLLFAIVSQLLSWLFGYFNNPEWVADTPELDRLGKWFLFIGVAWWLGGSTSKSLAIWSLALAGFLLACFIAGGAGADWLRGLDGHRVDFNIRNAQHVAMFFGTALLGLLCFAPRIIGDGRWVWGRVLLWAIPTGLCLVGVVISQTRAVWLALSLVFVLILLLHIVSAVFGYRRGSGRRSKHILVLGAVAVFVFTGWVFKDTLNSRLEAEVPVIESVLSGDWDEVPYSSVGTRIHTWRAGLEWINERPLIGWGGEARGLVIDETEWLPENIKKEFGHLHNTFLDFAVSYGFLGISVIAALIVWVGVGTWRSWRAGVMPTDMMVFGYMFCVFYVIVSQFESYGFFWTGSYIQNLILGGVVTHIWRWQVESGQRVFGRRSATPKSQ
ncbi:O-antigen ligase family protein [Halomonas sp. V046]|uniref:O-antigen ligase family protein n=1 Tax=Halomonas sp. V046 TaxID=3459611 RepID=UPI0040447FDF